MGVQLRVTGPRRAMHERRGEKSIAVDLAHSRLALTGLFNPGDIQRLEPVQTLVGHLNAACPRRRRQPGGGAANWRATTPPAAATAPPAWASVA
jgi:hypothetical protein